MDSERIHFHKFAPIDGFDSLECGVAVGDYFPGPKAWTYGENSPGVPIQKGLHKTSPIRSGQHDLNTVPLSILPPSVIRTVWEMFARPGSVTKQGGGSNLPDSFFV